VRSVLPKTLHSLSELRLDCLLQCHGLVELQEFIEAAIENA